MDRKNVMGMIGLYLEGQIQKAYAGGIGMVVKKNKRLMGFSDDRRNMIKVDYTKTDREALNNFRVECFTVAGVGSFELERKLNELAVKIQEGKFPGQTKDTDVNMLFEAEARRLMQQYIPLKGQPPGGWLRTNLNTAVASSFQAAQYIRLQDEYMKAVYPYYMYKTVGDNKVRDEHAALDGKVWRADDPIWDTIWPPLDWNCRCYVEPMMEEEVIMSGISVERSDELKDMAAKNFRRNPGKDKSIWGKWLDSELEGVDIEELKKMFAEPRVTGGEVITVKDFAGYRMRVSNAIASQIGLTALKRILTGADEVWGELLKGKVRNVVIRYFKDDTMIVVKGADVVGMTKAPEERRGVPIRF